MNCEMSDSESESEDGRAESPDVKSTAVVKYSWVRCPVGYSQLQQNTDLKMPPSNWLSSATDSYGLQHALTHSAGFSSFRMAHMFPDCVGAVDVVSGAECIKNLLKLPYQPNGVVSMIVHRVENTLLLDDFDIYQYLMKSDWSWLKKFFYENYVNSISVRDRVTYAKNKSRYALQQKNLVSKFLYHSLPKEDDHKQLQYHQTLPEPDVHKTAPYPSFSSHTHNRNVIWTFENLQMLIGSDMPIFGGVDRPCVSLRLRDACQPINVLTGIDYWLDNLMCNVPEVIMCYHLDGIVRKYEPIKTEDLPNLKDSKFSPKVIRNVAQNILSFLKSNATKAGHTYWLFKGTNDDVVKLYDLSTLCHRDDSSDRNPFTIPVAMLLYRVARNMKAPCQAGHIKMLLENCIKLLPVEKYPHIVASSHFMLANLYIPTNTNPASPNFKDSSNGACECGDPKSCRRQEGYDYEPSNMPYGGKERSEGVFREEDDDDDDKLQEEKFISGDVAVHSLSAPSNGASESLSPPPPTVGGKSEERCFNALKYIKDGLMALKFFSSTGSKDDFKRNIGDLNPPNEENPKMAKAFESIPMGYESLKKNDVIKMAQPNVPIPMPFKSEIDSSVDTVKNERSSRRRKREGKTKKKSTNQQNEVTVEDIEKLTKTLDSVILRNNDSVPTWHDASFSDDTSWMIRLKVLLYEKALLSTSTLAEQYFKDGHYGLSYKYINIAQKCRKILDYILNDNINIDEFDLIARAGDNLFQFAKLWSKYESDYVEQIRSRSEIENQILDEIKADFNIYVKDKHNNSNHDFPLPSDLENAILMSGELYSQALKVTTKEKKHGLVRRVASVKNELGVKYMYDAQEQYTKHCNTRDNIKKVESKRKEDTKELSYVKLSKKAYHLLSESLKMFEEVGDVPNIALLHCNMGRFMRFRAHCDQITHSSEQKKLYSSATDHYSCALRILANENCESIRDLVRWELSSALFTQACLLQDSPPDDIPDPAAEAAEALRLALRNCPLTEGPRQCLYQFRAGILHHRLASLFHNQFRDPSIDASKHKAAAALSKINYEQSVALLLLLEDTTMSLTVQLEHVALTEYQANNSPGLKLKYFQEAFDLLQKCESIMKVMKDKVTIKTSNDDAVNDVDNNFNIDKSKSSDTADEDFATEHNLLSLFQQRLQYVLKSLIQLCMQKTSAWKKENENVMTFYKNSYSLILKTPKFQCSEVKKYANHLYDVLMKIKSIQS